MKKRRINTDIAPASAYYQMLHNLHDSPPLMKIEIFLFCYSCTSNPVFIRFLMYNISSFLFLDKYIYVKYDISKLQNSKEPYEL